MTKLTIEDKALLATPGRVGAKVLLPDGPLKRAMAAEGFIGGSGGLTVKGFHRRSEVARALEDQAFG